MLLTFVAEQNHSYTFFAAQNNTVITRGGGAASDFNHTAQISIEVPENVGVDSDSGFFSTPTTSVAEPSTRWLLTTLWPLGRLRRRWQR